MEHPSDEILQRFVTGKASREERLAVVAHLVHGCSRCARKLRDLMEPQPVASDAYEAAFDRLHGLVQPAGEACFATASAALRAASGSPRYRWARGPRSSSSS